MMQHHTDKRQEMRIKCVALGQSADVVTGSGLLSSSSCLSPREQGIPGSPRHACGRCDRDIGGFSDTSRQLPAVHD